MWKYRVRFEGENSRAIGAANTVNECNLIIKDFLDEHHYKPYYWRQYTNGVGGIKIDVGSWTEFFVIERMDGVPLTIDDLFEAEANGK
mgnify:FL=1